MGIEASFETDGCLPHSDVTGGAPTPYRRTLPTRRRGGGKANYFFIAASTLIGPPPAVAM
jgi:hypothetical protein